MCFSHFTSKVQSNKKVKVINGAVTRPTMGKSSYISNTLMFQNHARNIAMKVL